MSLKYKNIIQVNGELKYVYAYRFNERDLKVNPHYSLPRGKK